jgi:hypothetical protein
LNQLFDWSPEGDVSFVFGFCGFKFQNVLSPHDLREFDSQDFIQAATCQPHQLHRIGSITPQCITFGAVREPMAD